MHARARNNNFDTRYIGVGQFEVKNVHIASFFFLRNFMNYYMKFISMNF